MLWERCSNRSREMSRVQSALTLLQQVSDLQRDPGLLLELVQELCCPVYRAAGVRVPAKGSLAVIHPLWAGTRVLGRFLGVSVSTTPAKVIRTDFSLIPLLLPTWHFACTDQKRDQIGSR